MKLLASSTFRREPVAVPTARAFVKQSLAPLDLTEDVSDRLVLASAEAFNNVVTHAAGESFAVAVTIDDGCCTVSVADAGRGFRAPRHAPAMPPADEVGRRGLALMYALVDRVEVVSTPAGTAVVLVQGLTHARTRVAGAAGGSGPP